MRTDVETADPAAIPALAALVAIEAVRTRRDARIVLWCCVFWAVVMVAALPLGAIARWFGWL